MNPSSKKRDFPNYRDFLGTGEIVMTQIDTFNGGKLPRNSSYLTVTLLLKF